MSSTIMQGSLLGRYYVAWPTRVCSSGIRMTHGQYNLDCRCQLGIEIHWYGAVRWTDHNLYNRSNPERSKW